MLRSKISLAFLLIVTFTCQQACARHHSPASTSHSEQKHVARQRVTSRARTFKLWKDKNTDSGTESIEFAVEKFHYQAGEPEDNYSDVLASAFSLQTRRQSHLADSYESGYTDRLRDTTENIVDRLQNQLGKPYVWGGTSPIHGFDCSGLIFFAYNKHLASKLPRTANEMYHYKQAHPIAKRDLKRGDLVFFGIHSEGDRADHVGVYLGGGDFIEAPRTGLNIRISHFDGEFWQDHYLGARRILTAKNIL